MDIGKTITDLLTRIDDIMYYPVLIIIMATAGLYFTVLTRAVQIRLLPESLKLLLEPPEDRSNVSSLQAMLVSTASRVGTGNIVGVSSLWSQATAFLAAVRGSSVSRPSSTFLYVCCSARPR